MENKVPRKLKKELSKIDCIEKSAFYVRPSVWKVKLKEGIKLNKWTKRLVSCIYREKSRAEKTMSEIALKRQLEWAHKGISPIDSLYERAFRDKRGRIGDSKSRRTG